MSPSNAHHVQSSSSYLLDSALRHLIEIFWAHTLICVWILFVQWRLDLLSPIASVLLINVNLVCLAERSWWIQAKTMSLWHPVVQLFFCVSRMVQGVTVILAIVLWVKILLLLCATENCFPYSWK
jgi:hypothetical protein